MACNCGHEHHHHFSQEQLDKAVKMFYEGLGKEIDLDVEYEKIKNKESDLTRSQREAVIAIVEYKKEHFKE